jgi:hypothetical protein
MEGDSQIPKGNRMNEQIDQLVYQLYDLTDEEIEIIESSIN